MSERYSARARRAVEHAGHEAGRLGHAQVGDVHLLLGLLHERRGPAARELKSAGVELRASRAIVESSVRSPEPAPQSPVEFDLSGKRALQMALHEAMEHGDAGVDAPHLLAGVIAVDGVAANVIRAQGATPTEVAARVKRRLGPSGPEGLKTLETRLSVLDVHLGAAKRQAGVAPERVEALEAERHDLVKRLDALR
jgi:ATP-dependent Clp protease ATP-binding subunit ClpC